MARQRDYRKEYRARQERGRARAAREGRPFSSREASGHKNRTRDRELGNLRARTKRLVPPYQYPDMWSVVREVYRTQGYQATIDLLTMKRKNTEDYLSGKHVDFVKPYELPKELDSIYWYHGVLG